MPADRVVNVFAARERHTATLLPDGRVLVVGGLNGTPLASAQLYDPATGLWTTSGSLNTARYQHTSTLLPNGRVLVVGGLDANGAQLASAEIYDTRFSDLVVEQPLQTVIPDGGATDFGPTAPGIPVSLNFFIENPGSLPLTGLTVTVDGANAADFTVIRNPPALLLGLERGAFTVQFAPTNPGVKTATIHIANNSSPALGKSPYDISLTGRLLSNTADTDGDGISDAQEWLMRTLGFNWQASQPPLVAAYYATANGSGLYNQAQYDSNRAAGRNEVINAPNTYSLYTLSQVQALNVGVPLLTKDAATGKFKLTIGVKKSTNLATVPFTDFPMNGAGFDTFINAAGKLEFEFTVPGNAAFFRVQSQ